MTLAAWLLNKDRMYYSFTRFVNETDLKNIRHTENVNYASTSIILFYLFLYFFLDMLPSRTDELNKLKGFFHFD